MDDATRARLDCCIKYSERFGDKQHAFEVADVVALRAAYDAQVARLAQLEPCYEDARTTAARLVMEQEEYARAVRNLTERAEFANQRADAQAARLAVVDNPLVISAACAWARGCVVPQCDMCRAVAAIAAEEERDG